MNKKRQVLVASFFNTVLCRGWQIYHDQVRIPLRGPTYEARMTANIEPKTLVGQHSVDEGPYLPNYQTN